MAKRKFDLSCLMDTVSNLDTTAAAPNVQMIDLEDILDNKANFYRVDREALKPLADSIAMDGLQQYPLVTPHPDQPGKYLLLSGHRRCAAIRLLVEDAEHPREDLRQIPCTVRRYESPAMAELQLILANSTARVLTNAEIAKQAERMELLLYQLKEEGYELPGRMRDQVAAACRVSAPKLARLKVIREKLKAPEFLLLFEKDKLPEQTAYALARLPEELQRRVALISTDISGGAADRVLKKCSEGWMWEPEMRCPDGKQCRRGDSFLRHDLDHPYEMCGGRTCCLECPRAKESYAENIKLAMELGVDQGLVQKLSDGRQESAQILAAIVQGGQQQIDALNDQFARVELGKGYFAKTVADMEVDFKEKMGELVGDLNDAIQEMDLHDEAYTIGMNNILGLLNGADSQRDDLVEQYAQMGKDALAAYKREVGQASPSKKFQQAGSYDIQGIIQGAESERARLEAAYTDAAQAALRSMERAMPSTFLEPRNPSPAEQTAAIAAAVRQTEDNRPLIQLNIDHMEVRSDADIDNVAQKLYYMVERETRGRGGVL